MTTHCINIMIFLSKIFNWYFSKDALPYWSVLLLDSIIVVFCVLVSTYLWYGGVPIVGGFWRYIGETVATLPIMWAFMKAFHTYSGIVRYSSFSDLIRVAWATACGMTVSYLILETLENNGFIEDTINLRIAGLTFILSTGMMWAVRILAKYLFDIVTVGNTAHHVLIYGVRKGGLALAKSMRNEHPQKYIVKGFVTPEKEMAGRYILGASVYSSNEDITDIIRRNNIQDIFVSPLFAGSFRENGTLVNALTQNGVHIMMMQKAESWDGKSDLSHKQLHEVDIEDLLPRDKIEVDMDAIGSMLKDKRVLITGAAGSIGSEMARQVAKFHPAELILVDQAETPMHDVRLYMANNHKELKVWTIVGSITNQGHMDQLFSEHRPEYVFHAAAYKHVPMMEDNPAMAVQNNIYGTRVIADLAVKYGTKKFVMISTDKAVNPTNVMGCSKRICEIYCQALNANLRQQEAKNPSLEGGSGVGTQFITTRFGNVLGSNGSVIPIFKEQIKHGGPVTVTHPDIIRYFMLIPEACQLVLEAGTMGKGGEIFVFDMGKPVRIADLAQRMIDLSGAKNIEIKYTGLRDGEKLYEEVLSDAEQNKPTVHPKIMIAKVREYPYDMALRNEKELYNLSLSFNDMDIVKKMKAIVPEYKSKVSKYEVLDH